MIIDNGKKYSPKQAAIIIARRFMNFGEVSEEMAGFEKCSKKDIELVEEQYLKLLERIENNCFNINMP